MNELSMVHQMVSCQIQGNNCYRLAAHKLNNKQAYQGVKSTELWTLELWISYLTHSCDIFPHLDKLFINSKYLTQTINRPRGQWDYTHASVWFIHVTCFQLGQHPPRLPSQCQIMKWQAPFTGILDQVLSHLSLKYEGYSRSDANSLSQSLSIKS